MARCVFCEIVADPTRSRRLYEDELAIGFHDINPQAPVHLLVIPRKHITSLAEAGPADGELLGHLLLVSARLAREAGLEGGRGGYRVVVNTGPLAGQTVFHVHLHVIGGRAMHWPPG